MEELSFSNGGLHFSAVGLGEGPLVICLHGFPGCLHSFRHQMPALAAAGYRVIAPCLRGYEPSSQTADGHYPIPAMTTDVIALMDHLGVEKAHLVGHDWGAAITYMAGTAFPDRFLSLTTMAVPHPGRFGEEIRRHRKQMRRSWYMSFFQLRGVSDFVVGFNNYAFIHKLWRDWSPGWAFEPEDIGPVIETLKRPGVKKAALGYYRSARATSASSNLPDPGFKVPVPTLALTGSKDGCIGTDFFQLTTRAEDFPAGLELREVPGVGHFLHQEAPETINDLLINWLGQHS
ncbi:MAG TPA: alpha/beta hydrolase [Rhodobiaceae bacterium]|nr:alpha/beta hydrolase [Rhodobiaceae bacterium]